MHVDAATIDATSNTVSMRTRGKMRLVTLDALDGRTRAARRARELIDAIEQDLGGGDRLSEGSRQLVQRAAVLGTFIESCEAQWLAGETVELADYLAAINSQRRVLATIGLERRAKDVSELSLAEYIARADSEPPEDLSDDDPAGEIAAETKDAPSSRRRPGKRHPGDDEPEAGFDRRDADLEEDPA